MLDCTIDGSGWISEFAGYLLYVVYCFRIQIWGYILAGTAFCALMNSAPHSASDAALMTAFITFAKIYMGPLKSVPSLLPK